MSTIYVNSNSPFYNTYKMYREYVGYKHPISYNRWIRLPEQQKAAYLYVQFYNEITLAWYKVKTQWSIEEEGVECINQYLIKNVEKIKSDKKRFTPQYIYKVAYNCLYCVCIDPSKNKERYYKETSETFDVGDEELSWFEFLGDTVDLEDKFDTDCLQEFFELLQGNELEVFIQHYLGEITDRSAMKRLKDLGCISGNTNNLEYRKAVFSELEEFATRKLMLMFKLYYLVKLYA